MKYQKMAVLLFISVAIVGCASHQLKNTQKLEAAARKQALSSTISPQQALEEAEELLKQAKREELELFAPLHMKEAEKSINEAQFFMNSKNNEKVLESSFKAKQMVFAGVKNKALVKRKLNRSLEQFLRIKKIGSERFYPSKFKVNKDELRELFTLLESGEVSEAVEAERAVIESLTKLEIKTLYKKYVGLAEDVLSKAKSEKADELAVTTYKAAEQKIQNADEFIKKNFLKVDEIEKIGNQAMREANHAYLIAKEVADTKGMNQKQAEKRALYIESLLEKIATSLRSESGIGLSIADQSKRLADKAVKSLETVGEMNQRADNSKDKVDAAVKAMNDKLKLKEEELAALNNQNENLQSQVGETKNELARVQAKLVAISNKNQPKEHVETKAVKATEAKTEVEAESVTIKTEAVSEADSKAAVTQAIKPAAETDNKTAVEANVVKNNPLVNKPDIKQQ